MTTKPVPCFTEVSAIPASWLDESFRQANERTKERPDLIMLNVGEPAFSPPDSVADELAAAALDGQTRYVDVQGLLKLREQLVAKLDAVNNIDAHPDRIFVTPGSCQGLAALMRSLAKPGAEILMPEIHWPVHLQQALLAELRPVFYRVDECFAPDPDSIQEMASPHTRILLLNTPSNPAGAVADQALLRRLYHLAASAGWQVISDEAYEDFTFESPHFSIGAIERGRPVKHRIVNSVFTFSKGHAMTGYRLGYVSVSRPAVGAAMRVVQESNIIAPSAPIQYAGLAALEAREILTTNRCYVLGNRDLALPPLVKEGLLRTLPGGGWYVMVDISSTGMIGEEFADELLARYDVAVVPGSGFSAQPAFNSDGTLLPLGRGRATEGLVRIAFCVDRERLVDGVQRIVEFVHEKRDS